ncbi:unnamed protein product [Rotaria sordida]|uniref:PPM-type phosphatase domain-containing protein n=1 Tax=Rotaria sordida TaxID=392033 RepID=A0A814M944_9BILA|nr:unnamed protein product [Rotaria sordida]
MEQLYFDHKPNVRQEEECIRRTGGRVTKYKDDVPHVENQLAVSRALLEYSIDKHIIPALPDIIQYSKQSSTAYIIFACDGIWDVINNQQVGTFVSNKISSNILQDIISQLLDEYLKLETMDNMSVYIVKL